MVRALLWLLSSSSLLGCSSLVGFDELSFEPWDAGLELEAAASGDGSFGDGAPSDAEGFETVDGGLGDAEAVVPPPPVPPPPASDAAAPPPPPSSPCLGATGHRVVRADPGAVLEGTCPAPTSPSVMDSPEIRLVSWTLDGATCAFTRVRSANYGSSGWTSTDTGFYTSPRNSEGESRLEQWGSDACTRRQLFRWTDID